MVNVAELKARAELAKKALKEAREASKAIMAEAKEAGIKISKDRAVKVPDSPEVTLMLEQFKSIFEQNAELISKLYKDTITAEDEIGNIGLNFVISDKYGIQLLNLENRKAKGKLTKK